MSLAALCPPNRKLIISSATQQAGLIWRTPHTLAEPFLQSIDIDKPRIALLTEEYLHDPTLFARLKANSPSTWVLICLPTETRGSASLWETLDQLDYDVLCKFDELVRCLRTLKEGNFFVSSLHPAKLLSIPGFADLTMAERRVLRGICEHKTSPQIAEALFITQKTVDNHRYNMAQKLNITGGPGSLTRFVISHRDQLLSLLI